MNRPDRIGALSERLEKAADARNMATTNVWADMWSALESELLERALRCAPGEDIERHRLLQAIDVGRTLRKAIEHEGKTVESLQKELDHLEGRVMRPVA